MHASEQLKATRPAASGVASRSLSDSVSDRRSDRLLVVLLFLLALAPRLIAPGDFWTADEAKHWSVRVDTFLPALQDGDYAATNLVGHPGVTTMWLGSAGVLMHQGFAALGVLPADDPALYRTFLRVPVALVTALCIALAFPLLRRLFSRRVALMTTLLWAGDPFLVAHSKVLHVDALLTSFVLLSLLTALVAMRFDAPDPDTPAPPPEIPASPRWGLLLVSAVMGGLALLTKSPSLILFPLLGLIVLVGVFWHGHPASFAGGVWGVVRALFVWGIVAAVTWVALWPAAWVNPAGAVWTVLYEIVRNGAEPHGWGNFFLGRAVEDPGPLFYPVAVVFRLTPWTTAGLLVAGVVAAWQMAAGLRRRAGGASSRLVLVEHWPMVLLLVFALVFIGVMSVLAKKFDRYVLPTFPVIDLVAGLGLLWLFDGVVWLVRRASAGVQRGVTVSLWGVLVVAMAVNLWWYHPYELAYFNQLLGGGPVAQRNIIVGWGEGLEKAASYIAEQENGCDLGVASWYEDVILPYTCSPVLHQGYISVPGHIHYAVLYINQVQRNIRMQNEIGPVLRERGSLVHTVRIHGIDYAWVYQLRQPRQHELTGAGEQVTFGSAMQLTGYDVDTTTVRSSGVLTLTLQWRALQTMDTDFLLFVHVFDDAGNQVGQLDVPPGGMLPTSTWGHNRFIDWVHRVPVSPDVDTSRLWLTLGVYDPATFARLPLRAPPPPDGAPDDGANALVLVVETPALDR